MLNLVRVFYVSDLFRFKKTRCAIIKNDVLTNLRATLDKSKNGVILVAGLQIFRNNLNRMFECLFCCSFTEKETVSSARCLSA